MRTFAPILSGLMALAVAISAVAQDAASAKAFVVGLYAAYHHGDGPDLDRGMGRIVSPTLVALIKRDRALTPKGDVGALDFDPICSCQDAAGLKVMDLQVATPAQGRATARVALRFAGGDKIDLRLDLISTAQGWRIDDIHSKDTPSLAAYLRQHGGGR